MFLLMILRLFQAKGEKDNQSGVYGRTMDKRGLKFNPFKGRYGRDERKGIKND
jgi:hypothetical protein